MIQLPKHGMIALDIQHAFACRPADSDESDGYRWSFRHAVIRAISTALLVAGLIVVFLL